jgi:hypothetical protein
MKIYRIRDKSTGKFSSGGRTPRWTKNGKVWFELGHVKLHLNQVHKFSKDYYLENSELVAEYFVVDITMAIDLDKIESIDNNDFPSNAPDDL